MGRRGRPVGTGKEMIKMEQSIIFIIRFLLPFIAGVFIACGLHIKNKYMQTTCMILGVYVAIYSVELGDWK